MLPQIIIADPLVSLFLDLCPRSPPKGLPFPPCNDCSLPCSSSSPGLFEQRVEQYLEELPDTEQSGMNKFLRGLGKKHGHWWDGCSARRLYPKYSKPIPLGIYIGAIDRTVSDPLMERFPSSGLQEHLAEYLPNFRTRRNYRPYINQVFFSVLLPEWIWWLGAGSFSLGHKGVYRSRSARVSFSENHSLQRAQPIKSWNHRMSQFKGKSGPEKLNSSPTARQWLIPVP